jgi:hypothetical protein
MSLATAAVVAALNATHTSDAHLPPPVRACAGQLTHLFEALACCCCCAAPDLLQPRPLSCQLLVQLGHIRRVTALHQALTNLIIPAGAQT